MQPGSLTFPRTEEVRQSLTSSVRPHQNAISIAAAHARDPKQALSIRRQLKIIKASAPTLLPSVSPRPPGGDLRDELQKSLTCGDTAQLGAVERSSGKLCQRTVREALTSDFAMTCRSIAAVRCS
jgi:hypothetical protein